MALNLSTLTNPANSSVLEEVNTTADFLESVPVFRNLSRGSNKGGDAKQSVSLNQPRALPLIKNPQGNLGGYLYIPNVTGNYATGPSVTIGANQTWQGELDMVITQFGSYIVPMGGGFWSSGFGLIFENTSGGVLVLSKAGPGIGPQPSGVTLGTPFNVKYGYDGTDVYVDIDGVRKFSNTAPSQAAILTQTIQLNQQNNLPALGNYAIQKAKLTVNSSVVFDCDFNGSTSIRHGDTKLQAAVGGPVTINQAGNDPATIIKKPVLRFDGTNDFMNGLLNQTVVDGYMFAAFSVLGDGGETAARIFGLNSEGVLSANAGGVELRRDLATPDLMVRYNTNNITTHSDFFNDERGDYLLDVKVLTGSQKSKVNNADLVTGSATGQLSAEEFSVASLTNGSNNAAIDLEFLALFSADSVPDEATASKIRNYINNRNNVFSLVDNSFYFYDAQKAPVGNISSGSSAWNGRIVGSDNGDTDKLATQATSNDSPVGDGFKVTFADNSDHLDIPSTTQAGWQVVGTSLGTFAYRVNANAVTELNLLGNLGNATYRQAGQSYGMILLPESATGADIEAARKLLIDRGAADGTPSLSYNFNWYGRTDIVEFNHINTANLTSLTHAWNLCTSLEKFPALDLSNALYASFGWANCSSLSSFGAIDARNSAHFTSSWQNCSALQSFPAGAKLGTSASSVNFSSAWQSSGLTSFPAVDLGNGTTFSSAWNGTSSLLSFSASAKLGTNKTNVSFVNAWINSGLTSFPALDLSTGNNFTQSWYGNSSLTDFSADAKLGTAASNVNFINAWRSSGLTSFSNPLRTGTLFASAWQSCSNLESFNSDFTSATNVQNAFLNCSSLVDFASGTFDVIGTPGNSCFLNTWSGCAALSANSVENILVSINTSGKSAPSTNPQITIDYNTATGSLSAATNAAVDSLKSKGWVIVVNGVTL